MTRRIWIRICVAAAIVWLIIAMSEIPGTSRNVLDMIAAAIFIAVIIILGGFVVQWLIDYFLSKRQQ